jgi:ankyrin repeat protein
MGAALEGRTEAVKTLLESGADVNEDDEGRTALMFAVTNIQTDSVNLLLDQDAVATANDGCTALMLAASSGETALMLTREKNYTEIAKLLQKAGARR